MSLKQYIKKINDKLKSGTATEHTYRVDLQEFIQDIVFPVEVNNEEKRIACGAPDLTFKLNKVPIGYLEHKKIDVSLDDKKNKEQFDRYINGIDNLIFSNGLEFRLYQNGKRVCEAKIGAIETINGREVVTPLESGMSALEGLFSAFSGINSITITNSEMLAKEMANKTKLLAEILENCLNQDIANPEEAIKNKYELADHYNSFKETLISTISVKEFSDMYAQTIAYGMFAARLNQSDGNVFTRVEASNLIPHSNPFLRKMFNYLSNQDLDKRISWIVDIIANVFNASDIKALLKDFGSKTQQTDPFIHFYETFLAEYNPQLRKSRGVWYTPEPIVKFIVRAVDEILKKDFNLKDGIANNSKVKDINGKEVHKVQILDPATGTGTFLGEVIKYIYENEYKGKNEGMWNSYVDNHLIPRLNGFEILMASYAMAHIKLDLLLKQNGYTNNNSRDRFKIYLTNSLDNTTMPELPFNNFITNEVKNAKEVKNDVPVMCVIGNPPYNANSVNKSEWIMDLLEEYKKSTDSNPLNAKAMNDDYVKFIRAAQSLIDKNKEGLVAFINNNGFIDNVTFRGMRYSLLKSFDKIYIIDLHGNARKKEKCEDGSNDENVFDIMQGVSINIFIKDGSKEAELAKVYHCDVCGKREDKYDILINNDIEYTEVDYDKPNYFFCNKDNNGKEEYNKGFILGDLFELNCIGIMTARDNLSIHFDKNELKNTISKFISIDKEEARLLFNLREDVVNWKVELAQNDLKTNLKNINDIQIISYRPFDNRYTYFTGTNKGIHKTPSKKVMQHFINHDNIGLCLQKIAMYPNSKYADIFVCNNIINEAIIGRGTSICPLYIYPESNANELSLGQSTNRIPNLNKEIVQQIESNLNLSFVSEKEDNKTTFSPIDILDYIYAVLHSPIYREKYKEFLKIDFPRVPYPNIDTFWNLVEIGGKIRELHLLESSLLEDASKEFTFPIAGDNIVEKVKYIDGKVYINDTQYFNDVPEHVWNFYIGGYQPCQKWLKDRKGRTLEFDDVSHYQRMVKAMMETDVLMKEIDNVINF